MPAPPAQAQTRTVASADRSRSIAVAFLTFLQLPSPPSPSRPRPLTASSWAVGASAQSGACWESVARTATSSSWSGADSRAGSRGGYVTLHSLPRLLTVAADAAVLVPYFQTHQLEEADVAALASPLHAPDNPLYVRLDSVRRRRRGGADGGQPLSARGCPTLWRGRGRLRAR